MLNVFKTLSFFFLTILIPVDADWSWEQLWLASNSLRSSLSTSCIQSSTTPGAASSQKAAWNNFLIISRCYLIGILNGAPQLTGRGQIHYTPVWSQALGTAARFCKGSQKWGTGERSQNYSWRPPERNKNLLENKHLSTIFRLWSFIITRQESCTGQQNVCSCTTDNHCIILR